MTLIRSLQLLLLSALYLLNQIPKSFSDPNFVSNWCPLDVAPNSKYQKNLNTVLRSLSSNSTNPDGFYYSSSGNNNTNDIAVYGNFLCRGDLNASACSNCVNTATTIDLPQKCPNGKKSIIWYDECMVRYSNHSFYGVMIENPGYNLYSNVNVTISQNNFFKSMEKAMMDVALQAANGTSRKKYATSTVNIESSGNTLYSLAQCTPDLTPTDCQSCLKAAVGNLNMSDGARVLSPSCNVRYEVYPFFGLSSPAPAPSSSRGANSTGATTSPTTATPPRSASCKMTSSPYLNIIIGFGILFVGLVNFQPHII